MLSCGKCCVPAQFKNLCFQNPNMKLLSVLILSVTIVLGLALTVMAGKGYGSGYGQGYGYGYGGYGYAVPYLPYYGGGGAAGGSGIGGGFRKKTIIIGPAPHAKTCLRAYADSEGLGQPAHPRNLIRAFVVRKQNHWILHNVSIEQMPGWDFTYVQDGVNSHMLRMFEGTPGPKVIKLFSCSTQLSM